MRKLRHGWGNLSAVIQLVSGRDTVGLCFQQHTVGWQKYNRGRRIDGEIHDQAHSDLPAPSPAGP